MHVRAVALACARSLLLLIGWALWLGSANVWLIPPLFVITITTRQIVPEERALARLFGAPYLAYRGKVARWNGRRAASGCAGSA